MKYRLWIQFVGIAALACPTPFALAGGSDQSPTVEVTPTRALSPQALSEAIQSRWDTLPEFRLIREYARAHGLRVWLAGDAAASFAYAVKHDLLFDTGLFKQYSETDHTDLYRFIALQQKANLVIDGDWNQTQELFRILENAPYPYRTPTGNFWNVMTQYGFSRFAGSQPVSDAFSNGMVEVTASGRPTAGSAEFLGNVIANTNPVTRFPALDRFTDSGSLRDAFSSTLIYLSNLARFQLPLPPHEASKIREMVRLIEAREANVDLDPAYTLLYDAYDLPKTLELMDQLGLLKVLYRQRGEYNREPFYYFVSNLRQLGVHSFNPQRYRRYLSTQLKQIPNHSIVEGTYLYSGRRPYVFVDYEAGDFPRHRQAIRDLEAEMKEDPLFERLRRVQYYTIQTGYQGRQPGFWLVPGSCEGQYDCRDRALLFHLFLTEAGYANYFHSTAPHTYNVVIENGLHYRIDPQFVKSWPPEGKPEGEVPRYDFHVWVPAPEVADFHHPGPFRLPTPCGWALTANAQAG